MKRQRETGRGAAAPTLGQTGGPTAGPERPESERERERPRAAAPRPGRLPGQEWWSHSQCAGWNPTVPHTRFRKQRHPPPLRAGHRFSNFQSKSGNSDGTRSSSRWQPYTTSNCPRGTVSARAHLVKGSSITGCYNGRDVARCFGGRSGRIQLSAKPLTLFFHKTGRH